jgi:molecular chaperone GrpE
MGLKSKVKAGDVKLDDDGAGEPIDGAQELHAVESQDDAVSLEAGEVAKLRAEVLDLKDKYLRSLADFENFRKRSVKERADLLKYQGESILVDVLDVLDSFERALENPGSELEKFKEGVRLIHKQFVDALGKWDVRGESSVGKEFDPMMYRAIGKAKVEGQKPNIIIGELRKTYLYKDKILRIGEVMVNEGVPETSAEATQTEQPQSGELN